MAKKDIDWGSLSFSYMKTDYRYISRWKDGKWDDGVLSQDGTIKLSECAEVLQYAQQVFEGLKVYETVDGRTVTFRPDLNGERMMDSAARLEMPQFPVERFVDAVKKVAKADIDWVPPYGTGAALYLRPFMFGFDPVIGVAPASEFEFRILATPVGPYFKGGMKPITVRFADFDRAAPRGTGHIKAALNYAMSLHPLMEAHRAGYSENFYLDPKTNTKIEETGGANIIFITKDGTLVTPQSNSILPSVTRRSLEYVAEHYLNMKVEEREVYKEELADFAECGVCGTAAVICPVGKICDVDAGTAIELPSGMEKPGPYVQKLYDTLTGIQMGRIDPPEGWVVEIK